MGPDLIIAIAPNDIGERQFIAPDDIATQLMTVVLHDFEAQHNLLIAVIPVIASMSGAMGTGSDDAV